LNEKEELVEKFIQIKNDILKECLIFLSKNDDDLNRKERLMIINGVLSYINKLRI